MNEIIKASQLPAPRVSISVRAGTMEDVPFMDEMQKVYQKSLGFTPKKQIEGKISLGQVLVAWASRPCSEGMAETAMLREEPLGFCIWQDKYSGRDDVGIFYQVVVRPDTHRKLVGAALVKSAFERAAYGCRLFCCWCAQDIDANYFWQSIGFVPLAFRTGNRAKTRTHIFWMKRIREGDATTPYWFPSETRGGMMNEPRLVIPIPPGTSWKDAKPIVLPSGENPNDQIPMTRQIGNRKSQIANERFKDGPLTPASRPRQFGAPSAKPVVQAPEKPKAVKKKREAVKIDPKYKAAARELRDRYLEKLAAGEYLPEPSGKYEVSRQLEATAEPMVEAKLLPLAA